MKAVYFWEAWYTGIYQYPERRSMTENTFFPARNVYMSSMLGNGYLSGIVLAFTPT